MFAQKPFEGSVKFDIKFEGMPEQQAAMFEGSTIEIFIKGDKSRSETKMGPINQIGISDNKAKTTITCMDVMGQKYMIRSNEEDMKKKRGNVKTSTKFFDETKTVAGYKCSRVDITYTDSTGNATTFTWWYTADIPYTTGTQSEYYINGMKGYPLEMTMANPGGRSGSEVKMTMTATSVSKGSVDDSKFVVPEGYKEMTKEDMKKMMGGH